MQALTDAAAQLLGRIVCVHIDSAFTKCATQICTHAVTQRSELAFFNIAADAGPALRLVNLMGMYTYKFEGALTTGNMVQFVQDYEDHKLKVRPCR